MVSGGLKINILITQRINIFKENSERRDCLDLEWTPTLNQMFGNKVNVYPMPNNIKDPLSWLKNISIDLIVLSGGNDIGEEICRDNTEKILLDFSLKKNIPVLGVCRGLQFLQKYYGGDLRIVTGHIGTNHFVYPTDNSIYPKRINVNSFHNYGIPLPKLVPEFEPLFIHMDNTVEAFCHKKFSWLATMWHPERYSPDRIITNNWIRNWFLKTIKKNH